MDKNLKHIGQLKGKVLLFGGVYSNLQALERLIQMAKDLGIAAENCICTGDIVGYCGQPEETVRLFRDWGAQSIAGNVELQLAEGAVDCGCDFAKGSRCDGFSKSWYPFAQQRLSKDSLEWMNTLPDHITFTYGNNECTVVHGSFQHVSDFVFKSTPTSVKKESFTASGSDIIIAGHSGLPFHQRLENQVWINPGVIGMPANEGTTNTWCISMEVLEQGMEYTYQKIVYDFEKAYNIMVSEKLPREYAETLISGFWDNMEILPSTEKELKGIVYDFETYSIITDKNDRNKRKTA